MLGPKSTSSCFSTAGAARIAVRQWAAYYHTALPAETFLGLDLVIFDRAYHPDIEPLKGKTQVLAYLSIGEVHGHLPEREVLERERLLFYNNIQWDSYAVDLTSSRWQDMLMLQVEDALAQGFDGVFLDTLDSPLHWARTQAPERLVSMQNSAISLIAAIRARYPYIKLMLNRGFEVAGKAGPYLDYLLAESILSYKDIFTGQFKLLPSETYAHAVAQLQTIIARAQNLQLLTLDYWNTSDGDGIRLIYEKQRAAGFAAYVTSSDLTRFTPEPLAPPH